MINKAFSYVGIFFLYLLSLLPLWVLYIFSDFLFLIIYYVARYRRKVVQENLRNAFPEKSEAELHTIELKFYRYFADMVVETIKAISISAEELNRRIKPTNPDLVKQYLGGERSIIAVAGHYCNWEWASLNITSFIDRKYLAIYKPLSNKTYDKFLIHVRSRFGGIPVAMKMVLRKMVELKNEPFLTVLLGDQTPVKHEATYFTPFLNQPTAVFLGLEKMAKSMDCVVAFYDMRRIKRGYYNYTVVILTEKPKETEPYEITGMHVKHLESIIREAPEYWLWSHRRWKFKPVNVENI
ncbi:MAG: lysophospholipid acyltransferase family protein [Mucilaginibacter sp.]